MDVLGGNVIAHCPIRNVLARVGDKWSLLILHTLWDRREPLRFKDLQRAIPDISQRVLSATLRRLHEDGLVRCEAFAEVPPRVEYTLTGRGESFHEACRPMLRWAILPGEVFFRQRQAIAQTIAQNQVNTIPVASAILMSCRVPRGHFSKGFRAISTSERLMDSCGAGFETSSLYLARGLFSLYTTCCIA